MHADAMSMVSTQDCFQSSASQCSDTVVHHVNGMYRCALMDGICTVSGVRLCSSLLQSAPSCPPGELCYRFSLANPIQNFTRRCESLLRYDGHQFDLRQWMGARNITSWENAGCDAVDSLDSSDSTPRV